MTQWNLDARAVASADRHYADSLALPDLRGLTDGLVPRTAAAPPMITDVESRETYAEMVREVQDLLRDIRFCTATGLMLAFDAGAAARSDQLPSVPDTPGLFITEAEMAVLLTNADFVPPSTLATDRHRHIGSGQTLGSWFGGLMFDTALLKCHGLLDRLTVTLWCRVELPITRTKAGELRYPTFNKETLKDLRPAYDHDPDWASFVGLIDTPPAQELNRYRHTATHQRRAGSAFNGGLERWHADDTNTDAPQHKLTHGMTALQHANAPLATYQELVLPALTTATGMIQRRNSASA